ncbi:hypothetical protein [Bradyrhizobium centrosematis]|uniref:hypothetical protein n=1 Tax=Bradyrhizobium centrosematis TaxID=1300039 RepID=UPI002169CF55|nr:hypothetical protein [Bradyrhizobium centrosematis]MCS3764100.1 hypothetical protein [Bradyrhizobium centrosematis]MCS3776847.1 hypothetical protein [Bradyrhizobium centrosematis]
MFPACAPSELRRDATRPRCDCEARWADWARGRAWFGASTVTGGNVAAVDVELVPEVCAAEGVA